MKKLLVLFYLFILPFSDSFSSVTLFGYPVFTWFNLLMFGISMLCLFYEMLSGNDSNIFNFILLVSFLITVVYSFVIGWPITKTLTNAVMYYLPFVIYPLIKLSRISMENVIKVMIAGLAIAAILSVLIGIGIIEGGVRDYAGASVSVYYVDGASGIFAILLGLYLLNSNTDIKSRQALGILCCVFGGVILLFYQSRGRILIALVLSFLMMLLISRMSGAKRTFLLLIGAVMVIGIGAIIVNINETLQFYTNRILNRITRTTIAEDNVSYRLNEIKNYWIMFRENPIFGFGWGALLNNNYFNDIGFRYNAHNMFFGMMGITGLSFAPILILKLVAMLFKEMQLIITKAKIINIWCLCMVGAVVLLGVANAGFGKYFCIAFMITVYTAHINEAKNKLMAETGKSI